MKKALIFGVQGQDGAWLASQLLQKGYTVIGTSRDAQVSGFSNLRYLNIHGRIAIETASLNDFRSVCEILIKYKPDEIYNLAGQTSVGLSFQLPNETFESISIATVNILECIRILGLPTRFYNASSSECFGDTEEEYADENTPFRPRSPYGTAKSAAFWQVKNYREAYNIYCCSGILFNHESILRPTRFVTRKIVSTAVQIHLGNAKKLELGNLHISRDWGYAPEYTEAMQRLLAQDQPDDYIICTGESHTLEEFVDSVFRNLNLDWQNHVEVNNSLFRPTDISTSQGNPTKAKEKLGWQAKTKFESLVETLIEEELVRISQR